MYVVVGQAASRGMIEVRCGSRIVPPIAERVLEKILSGDRISGAEDQTYRKR